VQKTTDVSDFTASTSAVYRRGQHVRKISLPYIISSVVPSLLPTGLR
jgi:hypothetical protein